jgi:aspartate ammonia-lyase
MQFFDYINSRVSEYNLKGAFVYIVNLAASYLQFAANLLETSNDPRQLAKASQAIKDAAAELLKLAKDLDKLIEESPEKVEN